jgi:hypothetical protein
MPAGVGDDGPSAESDDLSHGGLEGNELAAPALAANERPSSVPLLLRFREDVEEDEAGLCTGEEAATPLTVRDGDDVPNLMKLGLDEGSSSGSSSSTLEVRPSFTIFGLDSPTVLGSVRSPSDAPSDEISDKSR